MTGSSHSSRENTVFEQSQIGTSLLCNSGMVDCMTFKEKRCFPMSVNQYMYIVAYFALYM